MRRRGPDCTILKIEAPGAISRAFISPAAMINIAALQCRNVARRPHGGAAALRAQADRPDADSDTRRLRNCQARTALVDFERDPPWTPRRIGPARFRECQGSAEVAVNHQEGPLKHQTEPEGQISIEAIQRVSRAGGTRFHGQWIMSTLGLSAVPLGASRR